MARRPGCGWNIVKTREKAPKLKINIPLCRKRALKSCQYQVWVCFVRTRKEKTQPPTYLSILFSAGEFTTLIFTQTHTLPPPKKKEKKKKKRTREEVEITILKR